MERVGKNDWKKRLTRNCGARRAGLEQRERLCENGDTHRQKENVRYEKWRCLQWNPTVETVEEGFVDSALSSKCYD